MRINGPSLKIGGLRSDRPLTAGSSLRTEEQTTPPPGGDAILLENGIDHILLEDGSGIILLES